MAKEYVLGFAFDAEDEKVVLILKQNLIGKKEDITV